VAARDYETPIPVEKGRELGAFEMGSTVILVFEPGRVTLEHRLAPGARVRVGEAIGAGTEPPRAVPASRDAEKGSRSG
jgi:phosphatidylserine decarboxylase